MTSLNERIATIVTSDQDEEEKTAALEQLFTELQSDHMYRVTWKTDNSDGTGDGGIDVEFGTQLENPLHGNDADKLNTLTTLLNQLALRLAGTNFEDGDWEQAD